MTRLLSNFDKRIWPRIIIIGFVLGCYFFVRSEHMEIENNTVLSAWIIAIGIVSFLFALFLLKHERWDFNWILCGFLLTIQLVVIFFWWEFIKSTNTSNIDMERCRDWSLFAAIFTIIVAILLTILKLYSIEEIEQDPNHPQNILFFKIKTIVIVKLKNFQNIITSNRPGYMFIALTLFLSTMFFISFSFAFHDRYSRKFNSRCSIIRTNIDPSNGKLPEDQNSQSPPKSDPNKEKDGIKIKQPSSNTDQTRLISPIDSSNIVITCSKPNIEKISINFTYASAEILYNKDIIKNVFDALNDNSTSNSTNNYSSNENIQMFHNYDISIEHIEQFVIKYGLARIDSYYNGNNNKNKETKTITLLNSFAIAFIISTIKQNIDTCHFIISLDGYANKDDIKNSNYPSNYELSESRAIRVRELITFFMTEYNLISETSCPSIDWIISPMTSDCPKSNDNDNDKCLKTVISISKTIRPFNEKMKQSMCDTIRNSHAQIFLHYRDIQRNTENFYSKKFSAESATLHSDIDDNYLLIKEEINLFKILLTNQYKNLIGSYSDLQAQMKTFSNYINKEKPPNPKLLDYLHYTIYTITTTGYGDMSPSDDFAKFLTSITNVFEILFGLIFFNVILSRGDHR